MKAYDIMNAINNIARFLCLASIKKLRKKNLQVEKSGKVKISQKRPEINLLQPT